MRERLRGSVLMFLALALSLIVIAASCSSDEKTSEGSEGTGSIESTAPSGAAEVADGTVIETTLSDFTVMMIADGAPSTFPAGAFTFEITNEGPSVHELVILKVKSDAGDLPVGDDNTVDEAGVELIDEVEDIATGASASLGVDLKAGRYALICNIPGHYQSGMFANLVVE